MQYTQGPVNRAGAATAIAACFLVALLEGIDIQSMGLAAAGISARFGLGPQQLGMALSASLVGLMGGAIVGGRLSDIVGRRAILLVSILLLGVFSLATIWAPSYEGLLLIRFLAGLGMGGAFPVIVAIASESAAPEKRATVVSLVYCGMPIGGALAGLLASVFMVRHGWQFIFYVGGLGPLLMLPMLLRLPGDRPAKAAGAKAAPPALSVLFSRHALALTLLLWLASLCTLSILYLMLNWMPSLMQGKGFSATQAPLLSMILNIGAAIGSVATGWAMDRYPRKIVLPGVYAGVALALALLAGLQGFASVAVAAFLAGFFVLGGQLVLYAVSPECYDASGRGTGLGAAVAVGRLGAVAGPMLAGMILGSGGTASTVILAAIPLIVVGGVASTTVALLARRRNSAAGASAAAPA
jgi:AAHS family 3-hydroxyphenylpropionic acid transporter